MYVHMYVGTHGYCVLFIFSLKMHQQQQSFSKHRNEFTDRITRSCISHNNNTNNNDDK